jgi:hypothetical protein
VLSSDLVLPPKSGKVEIGSFCVENGRWTKRGTEEADRFASSETYLAHKDLKMANTKGDQGEVWQNVRQVQEKLAANLKGEVRGAQSASSLQLTLENERVRKGAKGYVRALAPLSTGTRAVARETESRMVIETQEKERKDAWIHQKLPEEVGGC